MDANRSNAPSLAVNACTSCKQRKRKCDKILPICSTCARVGRQCTYDESSILLRDVGLSFSPSQSARSDDGGIGPSLQGLGTGNIIYSPPKVDPYRYDTLRRPTIDISVSEEAKKIWGTLSEVHQMATTFCETIYQRIPILCRRLFFERLPGFYSKPEADFVTLCLCMHLVLQDPTEGSSMQSSLYVMVKSTISLLEAANILSLAVIQSRILITFYEIGHGILPAASISVSACARSAREYGLNKKKFQQVFEDFQTRVRAEEEKRVWWGVVCLDRFINLCNGDALFGTEDPQLTDLLPIDDKMWAQDVVPATTSITLSTPSDVTVGPFARECQILSIVGRVLRHVVDPASDAQFHAEEASQLERTMMAFMPLLMEEQTTFGLYCAALGMCSNALVTLYDAAIVSTHLSEIERSNILRSMESTSQRITAFSKHLFGEESVIEFETMSPFVPYSQFQAGVVQYRLWKKTGKLEYRENLDSLKVILKYLNRRWLVAGRYVEALEGFEIDWPSMMLSLNQH